MEVNGKPTMKLSEDVEKVTIPGRKRAYRLYGADGQSLCSKLLSSSSPMFQDCSQTSSLMVLANPWMYVFFEKMQLR